MVPRRDETRVEFLSDQMREFIGRCVGQFREAGFEVLANLQNPDAVTGAQGIHVVLANPLTDDTAYLIIASAQFSRSFTIFVASRFSDDRRIVTGARRSVGYMPRNPNYDTANFTWVRDPRVLCEAHRRRLDAAGRASMPRVGPDRQNLIPWLNKIWDEEMQRSIAVGYRYPDPDAQLYRYTWKGAIFITLKLLPIVKRIRARLGDVQARRTWKALKMDTFQPVDSLAITTTYQSQSQPADQSLQYLIRLAPGHIRREHHNGAVIVRIGGQTLTGALTRCWLDLTLIIFYTALVAFYVWFFLRVWLILPGVHLFQPTSQRALCLIWLVFAIPSIWRITRAISGCSGTIVLTATKAGLQYNNVPRWRDGQVPRDDIHGLMVARTRRWFCRPAGRLYLRLHDAHKKRLLIPEADVATLLEVRKDLADAMGIDVPPGPPSYLPPIPRT
jgi:hypothetical protein